MYACVYVCKQVCTMWIISETFILTEVDEEGEMKERFIWDI